MTDGGARTEANRAARELADRYWDELMELDPLWATQVGDERFDDRLPDPTEGGRDRRRAVHERALVDADAIPRDRLGETERTTLDVLRAVADRELTGLRFRTDQAQAVAHLLGPGMLLATLASIQRADTAERAERYVWRLEAIPAYLEGLADLAQEGLTTGFVAPALVVDRSIGQVERLLDLSPEESPGMVPAAAAGDEDRNRVAAALRDRVWPAYRGYLDALRRYRPSARDSIGLCALPDGEERYAAEIVGFVTIPLDPADVHRLGLERLAAIDDERRSIAAKLGHTNHAAALEAHRSSGRDTPGSRQGLVRLAESQVRRGWETASRWFGRLPERNCEVRAIEEFRERDAPDAYYQPPSGDNTRAGIYYVNTFDHAERRLSQLASITYHEANPGHHFQITIEQGFTGRPPLRRFGGLAVGSSFVEGWGLYSERLADEMGLYADDHERLGMLAAQAWRAARLAVDTGIHALGWDRDRAVATLHEAIGGARSIAEIEVDRYICWPGQALSYMVGQLEIERWRSTLARREGEDFSLRAFHDRLLSLGSLPLESLQRELEVGPRP
jgi:uncharacterized protein (DUF885 family)